MTEATIDLGLLDENEENPFDIIMSAYERVQLQMPLGVIKDDFEKKILGLERKLQDLSDSKDDSSKVLLKKYKQILNTYSAVITNDDSFDSIDLISKSINSLYETTNGNYRTSYEINKELDLLSPLSYLKKVNLKAATVTQLKKATMCSFTAHNLELSLLSGLYGDSNSRGDSVDSWDVSFMFKTHDKLNHKPLNFLYTFIEVLNNIEDVEVILEDIRIGSIYAKLKIYFRSSKAKDDVKEVLETSRKLAKGKLEKDFIENEKTSVETNKLEVEKRLLEHNLEEANSFEAAYLKTLAIQNAEEDLKRKKLDNRLLELSLMKETRDTYAQMLADGFISNSDFEMLIKGLPFLKIENGNLQIGENTQVIDDL